MSLPGDSQVWVSGFKIFDFTLKFEESFLEILPNASFLFFGSASYLYYQLQPVFVRYSPLLWIKLVRPNTCPPL